MSGRTSALVTILFTDLVNSTELLGRAGDEEAQRIFRAHHDLLAETAAAHGGEEVKWLGDGSMVAFGSAAEAVRAAVAMQRTSRRPVHGERLAIRVGLNAGEALRDAADWFGLPVVVARRLCDQAAASQILCTDVVAGLLAGRPEFTFTDLGKLELKGVAQPVAAFEVVYKTGPLTAVLDRMPFVGRTPELDRLRGRLAEAVAGRGGLALVAGEPGIGKTRLVEELAERVPPGAAVLWGSCLEGGWAPPYVPFAEAVEVFALAADPEDLRADLGSGGAPLAQLVPALRKILPELPEAVSLQPDEERFRLLDAVAQLFVARSERTPVVIVLDDLHWADGGTVAMLRHLARPASRHRILVLGTYRDSEVEPGHPLADALGAFPRETRYDAIKLIGLDVEGVTRLLGLAGDNEVSEKVGAAWARETEGNPFFLKELLRYLIDEGKLYRDAAGSWMTTAPLRELGIPSSVRDVVGRRLSRLSEPANRLLAVGAAFESAFRFDLVARVAELSDAEALDALDEALAAQLVQPAGDGDTCAFTHALVRYTIYAQLNAPRRLRLHRRLAEALEAAYGTEPSPPQAGEIASQYTRSAGLPGAERGVDPALAAAAHAEATGAHDEAAGFLRMALDLCPENDSRRLGILRRLGVVLTWALHFDDAVAVASETADAIARVQCPAAAADYLAEVAYACSMVGSPPHAWKLAPKGLGHNGSKRDVAWARLVMFDHQRREALDPEYPGIPLDTAERSEAAAILRAARPDPLGPAPMEAVFASRKEALATSVNIVLLGYWCGEFERIVPLHRDVVEMALAKGELARAARAEASVAFVLAALGRFDEMCQSLEHAEKLAARLGMSLPLILQAKEVIATATGEGLEAIAAAIAPLTTRVIPALAWAQGLFHAWSARLSARLGHTEEALSSLEGVVPWLQRAPAWTIGMPVLASHAAEVLWVLERLDWLDVIEAALREKVVEPDFRSPLVDGRLALARLCVLTERYDEAFTWFAKAREVLTQQAALPVLAIADFDEAIMYVRRGEPGDLDRGRPLLASARRQFQDIGMTGWLRWAGELSERLG